MLYDLADGLRVAAVALFAYLPETAPKILDALGQPLELGWERVAYGRLAPATAIAAAPPLFPRIERQPTRRRGVIDTHAHLGDDAAEVLAPRAGRRRDAGDRRCDDPRRRAALAGARRGDDGVYASSACTRTRPRASTSLRSTSCASCSTHPRAVAVGETGLDYFRDYAPHAAQQRLFDAQLALAIELGKPVVIHTRAADDDTLARLLGHDGAGDPPLLLLAAAARRRRSNAAGACRSPATSPTRTPTTCAPPRGASRPSGCSPRPTARISRRRRCAASGTSRPTSCTRSTSSPRCAASTAELEAQIDRTQTTVFGSVKVAPRKSLGQHFLVDENILGVIERLAALEPADVVLEIGPGLGVLTRFLAERVAHVHAAEVDRRLEPHLAGIPRTDVHWGDALRLDVAASIRRRASSSRTCRTTSRRRSSPRASRSSSSSSGA